MSTPPNTASTVATRASSGIAHPESAHATSVADRSTARAAQHFLLYIALFLPLLLWLLLWPYTGDGDSVLHYLCARTFWADNTCILGSWARPLHKVLILLPAAGGIVSARITQALLAVLLARQTVALARQMRMPNAILAAPLLVFQPYVFALGSDTMTELPMALAIVLALRLWFSGRRSGSCLVVSFLPALRPEGFFLIVMWGMLFLFSRRPGTGGPPMSSAKTTGGPPVPRKFTAIGCLSIGMLCWMSACSLLTQNPFYFLKVWTWPMQSYDAYPAGPIYHYAALWPVYCGAIFAIPFFVGIRPSLRRRGMGMIWAVWVLVFVLHSLLFWLHKFASVGLLRIMACTSPMTALICLEGYNAIGQWLASRGWSPSLRRRLAGASIVLAALWSMLFYALIGAHYHCFGYRQLTREINRRHLLDDYYGTRDNFNPHDPRLLAGDKMLLAMLDMNAHPRNFTESTMAGGNAQANLMAHQPLGTVGAWDSEQSTAWHTVRIEDLPALGYTIFYEYDQNVPDFRDCLTRRSIFSQQRYVIFRKVR